MFHEQLRRRAGACLLGLAIVVSAAAAAPPAVEVRNAWVRATVPAQKTSGAYFEIRSRHAARLLGAASPLAGSAEIHRTVHEGGIVKMQPVAAIELRPGEPVRFAPGGYHMMLMDLKQPLKRGDTVALVLRVRDADGKVQEINVSAEVRDPSTGASPHRH